MEHLNKHKKLNKREVSDFSTLETRVAKLYKMSKPSIRSVARESLKEFKECDTGCLLQGSDAFRKFNNEYELEVLLLVDDFIKTTKSTFRSSECGDLLYKDNCKKEEYRREYIAFLKWLIKSYI